MRLILCLALFFAVNGEEKNNDEVTVTFREMLLRVLELLAEVFLRITDNPEKIRLVLLSSFRRRL